MKGSAYVVLEVGDKLVVSMNIILKVECMFCSCSCTHVVCLYLYILHLEKLSYVVQPDCKNVSCSTRRRLFVLIQIHTFPDSDNPLMPGGDESRS